MIALKWIAKHKIWTFWIVVICIHIELYLSGYQMVDAIKYGSNIGKLFIYYLLAIWVYSLIKKWVKRGKNG